MRVLSLFDGMSCGQIALNRCGIEYESYFASEIEEPAIKVTMSNYPNTIQLGDVRNIDVSTLPQIDLLIGGSPCQSFSFAGKQKGMSTKDNVEILTLEHYLELKEQGFEFEGQSYLFWEYMRILTNAIGVEPILINSSLVSAQNRERLYWTNIPNVTQPQDRGIMLSDILLDTAPSAYNIKDERVQSLMKFVKEDYQVINKTPTLTTELAHSTGKNFYPKVLKELYCILGHYRRLTPLECERLQTVPDNYSVCVNDTNRFRMLGNGWTVDVIVHIFGGIL